MACDLTQGFTLTCGRDNVGGIKEVYVARLGDKGSITTSGGVITAFTMASGKQFFKYELYAETGSLTEASPVDVKNGTVFYDQKVEIVLHKLATAKRNELYLASQSPLMVIVKDSKDNYWLTGESFGMNLTKRDALTGKDMGDFAGYQIEFTGKESEPMKIVTTSLIAGLLLPA